MSRSPCFFSLSAQEWGGTLPLIIVKNKLELRRCHHLYVSKYFFGKFSRADIVGQAQIFTTSLRPLDSSIHRFDSPFPTMHSAFLSFQGEKNGLAIFIVDPGLFRPECVADLRHRKTGEAVMTFFYIVGAIAALFLMIYLVIALLKPELFS
jgi:K+-transporting ATPase KdpF subunit